MNLWKTFDKQANIVLSPTAQPSDTPAPTGMQATSPLTGRPFAEEQPLASTMTLDNWLKGPGVEHTPSIGLVDQVNKSMEATSAEAPGPNWFNIGGGALGGGAVGYGLSKLLGEDEDEEGITPEERERRSASNLKKTLALSTLGAAGGGTAMHMLA